MFRSLLRLAVTAAAAAAVARAAESARRILDELELEPARHRELSPATPWPVALVAAAVSPRVAVPHAFGPTPIGAPESSIGFRAAPTPVTAQSVVDELEASGELDDDDVRDEIPEEVPEPARDETVPSPIDRLLARRHASDHISEPKPKPEPEPETGPDRVSARDAPAPAPPRPKGSHRRTQGAVSGSITNAYDHGLRGLRVDVVDDDKRVVATATTGSKGAFVVDDVPAGSYRLRAYDDVDDDFEKSWHGGAKFAAAETFAVKADKTRRNIDVVLRSHAGIDVDVTVTERAAEIVVAVTHCATGAPATGEVELRSKDVDITLPLVDGESSLALGTFGKKLRFDYLGDHQTRPTSVKVRLS